MRKKNNINSQGFSFSELMIVIAIIGILSAIAIPNILSALPQKRLRNATRNLYADLQKARLQAVKENRQVLVWFDTDNDTYHFEEDDELDPGFGVWDQSATDNEFGGDFVDYGAVTYGCDDMSLGPMINIRFDSLGTVKDENGDDVTWTDYPSGVPFYLQSQIDDAPVCYAVTVVRLGIVKILQYRDSAWN